MRIAKSALIDPARNELYGIAALTLSLLVFAYSSRFGQISILAYYGVWFVLVLVDYRKVLGPYLKYLWIFSFGIFCLLSAFWSPAFGTSLRAAIQYLTHIVCALIAMRVISPRTLVHGGMVGCAIVLIYSMLFGSYHLDPMDNTYSFVGAFSSKNQLGFYASLGVVFCYAAVMLYRERGLWLLVAAGVTLIAAYSLFASQSATSVITTLGIVGGCVGLQGFMFFSPKHRRAFFGAAMVLGIGAIVAGLQAGAMDAILGVFGKDSTLTGRTFLWQQGILAASEYPIFGIGYQGYWVQGFADAERLWEHFYIPTRSGFHFHNTYIETMVETGAIGLALICMLMLSILIGHLKRLLTIARTPESLLFVGIASLLLVRSFVEIDVIFAYQIGSFLLFYLAGTLTLPSRTRSTASYGFRPQPIHI